MTDRNTNDKLDKLEDIVNKTKDIVKQCYKDIQLCKSDKEQEKIFNDMQRVVENINSIYLDSQSLDNIKLWEESIEYIDNGKSVDDLEQKCSVEYLFAIQMLRGKKEAIRKLIQYLNENEYDQDQVMQIQNNPKL